MRKSGLLVLVFLTGCSHHPMDCATDFAPHDDCLPGTAGYESAQKRAALAASMVEINKQSDDKTCKSYGLKFGTPAYAQCRQNLLAMRVNQGVAADNNQALIRQQAVSSILQNQNNQPQSQPYMMPTPTITNCNASGNSLNCTSR
jgi:hypothetical protein